VNEKNKYKTCILSLNWSSIGVAGSCHFWRYHQILVGKSFTVHFSVTGAITEQEDNFSNAVSWHQVTKEEKKIKKVKNIY
jgi:hypothetical protein